MNFPNDSNQHIRPEIQALADRGSITWEEWQGLSACPHEFELLYSKLTDEAVIQLGRRLLLNCSFDHARPWRSNNEAVMGFLAPDLLQRLDHILKLTDFEKRTGYEDERVVRIFTVFDQHMRDGRFDLCDRLLRHYSGLVGIVDVDELLAVLSITTPACEHLIAREEFARLVRARLVREDPERVEDLLRGLE